MQSTKSNTYSSKAWKQLSYEDKLKHWINNSNGKMPTYDSLIANLISKIKSSGSSIDGGEHTIEFPVPAVFYDHSLPTYRPDYEYETFMFNRLLGMLDDAGLVTVTTDTQILGASKDKSNYRPYIVTKVEFSTVDGDSLLATIDEHKTEICEQVIGNIAVTLL